MEKIKLSQIFRKENRFGLVGGLLLLFLLVVSFSAPLIAPFDPYMRTGRPFEKPNSVHILGCNDVGQDLLSELMYGGRISLMVGIFAAFFSTLTATVAALAAGYFGGTVDRAIMRIVDVIMSLPFLPLVIVLGVFLGPGMKTQILVISLVMWAHPCRELRSQVLKLRRNGYVDASMAMGEKSRRIIMRHVLPELMPLIVPQFVLIAQSAILTESSLSFLGLGDPLAKSWGSILFYANSRAAFLTGAWLYWVLPPGLCIALSSLSFSFIGFQLAGKKGLGYSPYGSFKRSMKPIPAPRGERAPLEVENLTVKYGTGKDGSGLVAVSALSLKVHDREVIGIVGESGCGKTTMAMTILALLRYPAEVTDGAVFIEGQDILSGKEMKILQMRGKTITYIPQNAMNTLNPVISVRKQLIEALRVHQNLSREEEEREVERLLTCVEIDISRKYSYNHELSGGMKQRVVIAMALANNPDILIADEPTTGLDVLVQKSILDLLMDLKERFKLSVMLITHDLPLAMHYSDTLGVMYKSRLVDYGPVSELVYNPTHPHTKALFSNFPRLDQPKNWNRPAVEAVLPEVENVSGDMVITVPAAAENALSVENICKTFYSCRRLFGRRRAPVEAVKNVSFTVHPGEVLGIIGGSGSGKTTLSRLIMGLEKPDSGSIYLDGEVLHSSGHSSMSRVSENIHMVFQDPYQSIRNSMSIFDAVAEPVRIRGGSARAEIEKQIKSAMKDVHLPSDSRFLSRTPSQLSGGQRQRLAFARAIVSQPRYILADEPTSMLDVSLRQELLKLMEELRERYHIGFIFITHDLSLAYHFCDRLMVMQEGRVVEAATSYDLIHNPSHEYTRELITAVETPRSIVEMGTHSVNYAGGI